MDFLSSKPRTEPGYLSSQKYYSDQFVCELSEEYGFDPEDVDILTRLYEIPYRFYLSRRLIEGDGDYVKTRRKELESLEKSFNAFQELFEAHGGAEFGHEIIMGAMSLSFMDPELDEDDYPGMQFSRTYCYYYEFRRYLNFFQVGLDREIKTLKSRGGRPANRPLDNAVLHIKIFWKRVLKREFTLDYHQGSGISEAFIFTKRLLEPIDDFSDREIVTAMRKRIKEDRAFEKEMSDPSF